MTKGKDQHKFVSHQTLGSNQSRTDILNNISGLLKQIDNQKPQKPQLTLLNRLQNSQADLHGPHAGLSNMAISPFSSIRLGMN
jgi:hypothetical protein